MPNNSSLVVTKPQKAMSMLQRKILEADLTGKYNTVTALAKAVKCDRQSVVNAQQLPAYIDSYNSSMQLTLSKSINIKKHSINELKVAMSKLQRLVEEDKSLNTYASYVKLLIDTLKGTAEIDLELEDESIDTSAIRIDLISLINVGMEGIVSPAELVDEYILTGEVPKSPVFISHNVEADLDQDESEEETE